MKVEFRDPPEGYALEADCDAIDGDLFPMKNGWKRADFPGYYYPIIARRKKAGLVDMFKAVETRVMTGSAGYRYAADELHARLAAIEREPTDEECLEWWRRHVPDLYVSQSVRLAIKAAREIGQGGA